MDVVDRLLGDAREYDQLDEGGVWLTEQDPSGSTALAGWDDHRDAGDVGKGQKRVAYTFQ